MNIRDIKKAIKAEDYKRGGLKIDADALGEMAERVTKVPGKGPPVSRDWFRIGKAPPHRKSSEDVATRKIRRAFFGKTFEDTDSKAGISFKTPKRERLPEEHQQPRPIGGEPVSEYSEEYQPEERGYTEVRKTAWSPQGKIERTVRKYRPFRPKIARLGPRKRRPES